MSEQEMPSSEDVEAMKERLKAAADDATESAQEAAGDGQDNLTEQLRNLGAQFSETIEKAWNSEEREKFEANVKEGLKQFGSEVEKGINRVRENERASRAMDGTADFANRLNNSDKGLRARSAFAQGLRKLSEGLGDLAEKFSEPTDSSQ